jgi:hypothetical protein
MSEQTALADEITSDLMGPAPEDSPPVPAPESAPAPEQETPAPAAPETAPVPPAASQPAQAVKSQDEYERELAGLKRAIKEEREKRQDRDKRIAEYERQVQLPEPSIHDDPDAYARFQADLREQERRTDRFDMSEVMAREKHGDEAVDGAKAWAEERARDEFVKFGKSPFAIEFLSQKHPIDWVVKKQKREAAVGIVGDDPEAYAREWALKNGYVQPPNGAQPLATEQATPAQTPTTASPPAPQAHVPRSLASQPNAGGVATTVPSDDQLMSEALSAASRPRKRGSG